jgi:2-polyprenyl-6-methoxyphenol hydroxylase-like FAD-dependent oxidoreductase
MADPGVLIVGAGPTGLVLALWLTKQGVSVRVIDKTAEPGTTSRALAVHARTLELYEQLGLAGPVVQNGYAVPGARLWLGGEPKAHVPFGQIASDLTPYGFLHIFPQDEHENLLIGRLEQLGVQVERETELVSFSEEGDHVAARLQRSDGAEETVQAAFIAGCDGPRSKVREGMDAGFPGGTYQQVFYVADVAGEGSAFNGDLNVDLDEADFLAIFPLADKGRVRLIGAIRPEGGKDLDKLTFDDVKGRAMHSLKLKVDKVNWFSTYHVHHRVADHFRTGRAFLLGDAAHVHTPVGGQGMNTGIGDAINLAWKLKAVLSGKASDRILDTYETERRAFALRLVKTTDQAFVFVATEGHFAEMVRKRIAPIVLSQMVKLEAVREFMFRTLSQITLNYRGKGLDAGHVGPVHGGDRLPWVKLGEKDNYAPLRRIAWQVHVYGTAEDQLVRWCDAHGLPLETFRWVPSMHEAGLRENALYLIRPDTYVAVAAANQDVAALEQFFGEIGLPDA